MTSNPSTSTWRPVNTNDSDDDDDEEGTFDFKGREAIVFVLDALLFEEPKNFEGAINLIRDALLSGLIISSKDLIGIVFANTKNSPPPKNNETLQNIVVPQDCALFIPLRQLDKDIVEYYLSFTETDNSVFETTYGASAAGNFASMLRLCGNMFQQCGVKLSTQTIVYFTDRDTPHEPDSPEFQRAIQKASDMQGQAIEFTLIPMRDDFDFAPFYAEFISLVRGIDMDSFDPTDPKIAREMIADRKLKLDGSKRCLGHVNWNLSNDLDISVKYYNYFQKSVFPQKVRIRREDNSLVTAKVENFVDEKDPETGDIVNRRELSVGDGLYMMDCGNERTHVHEHQMKQVKYPWDPILQLVGFRDLSALKRQNFLRPCSFVYPDDSRVAGSAKLFTALWQRCFERQKAPICIFIPRKKTQASYVALVPVKAEDTDEATRSFMNGDGFKVVYLPLGVDFNHFDLKHWNVAVTPSEEGQELLKKIVKKLRVKYLPSKIKDPALEELQSKLLELAFDIKTKGSENMQMPNREKQDERIEPLFNEFERIFGVEMATEKRRATSAPKVASSPKKPRVGDQPLTGDDIDQLQATGNLDSLNKDQMIDFLKANGVKVTKVMNKATLMEKIIQQRSDAS